MKKNQAVKTIVAVLTGLAGGAIVTTKLKNNIICAKDEKIDKFKLYYNLLNQWLMIKQEGKNLEQFFLDKNYHSIAIYGMGEMGNRLYEELKGTSIEVKYAIDKNAGKTYSELEVVELEDDLKKVDVIVVSAVFAFDEIEVELSEKMDCPIISLEDVVYEL